MQGRDSRDNCNIHQIPNKYFCTHSYCQETHRLFCEQCLEVKLHKGHTYLSIKDAQKIFNKVFEDDEKINEQVKQKNIEVFQRLSKDIIAVMASIDKLLQSSLALNEMQFQEKIQLIKNQKIVQPSYNYLKGKPLKDIVEADQLEIVTQIITNQQLPKIYNFSEEVVNEINYNLTQIKELASHLTMKFNGYEWQNVRQFNSNTFSNSVVSTISLHDDKIWDIIKLEQDQIITCSGGKEKIIQQINYKQEKSLTKINNSSAVLCLKLIKNNSYLLSGCSDGQIKQWRVPLFEPEPHMILTGHQDAVWNIVEIDENTVASSSSDKTIIIWDIMVGQLKFCLKGHEDKIMRGLALLDKNYLISSSHDKTCKIWNLAKQQCEQTFQMPEVCSCLLALNEDIFLSCHSKKIAKWKISTKERLKTINAHEDWIKNIIKLNYITLATCSQDKSVKIWTVELQLLFTLKQHTDIVNSICLVNNNSLASCGNDNQIIVWN